jgi:hypothetical protein
MVVAIAAGPIRECEGSGHEVAEFGDVIFLTVDARTFPHTLSMPAHALVSGILTGFASDVQRAHAPFEFGGTRIEPAPNGNQEVLILQKQFLVDETGHVGQKMGDDGDACLQTPS